MDLRGLAVHEVGGRHHLAAEDLADALVAQAHAQDGEFGAKVADDIVAHAAFFGSAGAGADDQVRGVQRFDLFDADLVVAKNLDGGLRRNFAEGLDQVVGEAVVIIDEDQHGESSNAAPADHGA